MLMLIVVRKKSLHCKAVHRCASFIFNISLPIKSFLYRHVALVTTACLWVPSVYVCLAILKHLSVSPTFSRRPLNDGRSEWRETKAIILLWAEIILRSKVVPWGFFKVSMERYSSPSGRYRPRSPRHVNCTFAEDPPDRINKFKGSFYIMWAKLLKPFVSFLLMKTRPAGGGLRESELLNHTTQQQD